MTLSHVSDNPAIALFQPRPSRHTTHPVVWAVDADHLANYLLPRDCPRVCFRAGSTSTAQDVETLLGRDHAVIAIEAVWLDRVQVARLYRYTLPTHGFTLSDANAGYWVSAEPVVPLSTNVLTDLPGEIASSATTLRVLPSLWALHDAVAASSLRFSMIRMRHAGARN